MFSNNRSRVNIHTYYPTNPCLFHFQLNHCFRALLSTLISTKDRETDSAQQPQQSQLEHVDFAAQILKLALDKWATPVKKIFFLSSNVSPFYLYSFRYFWG
jgi:hypothetical protein